MQEKNRNTLLIALQQLPEHLPPDKIWEAVGFGLDQGEAEIPLRRAIRGLPDHEPPAQLWQDIIGDVEQENTQQILHRAIRELPQHDPPEMVWQSIQSTLDKAWKEEETKSVGRIIPMWRRPAIAAGFTALICAFAWFLLTPSASEKVSMAYSTVEVDAISEDDEQIRDKQAFEIVWNEFDQQLALSDDPYLHELKRELEDLDMAKRQIAEVMGKYGEDENLILQMTNIEHDRSEVLKEMVTKI